VVHQQVPGERRHTYAYDMHGRWELSRFRSALVWFPIVLGVIASGWVLRKRRSEWKASETALGRSVVPRELQDRQPRRPRSTDRIVSIGTLITGVAAVVGLLFSSLTLGMQRQQLNVEQERREAAYAERLTYWWQATEKGVELFLLNANSTPMPAWIVVLEDDIEYDGPARPPVLGSGVGFVVGPRSGGVLAGPVKRPDYRFLGNIPPCSRIRTPNPLAGLDPSVENPRQHIIGSLLFVDPAGTVWRRSLDGELEKVPERPSELEGNLLTSRVGLLITAMGGPADPGLSNTSDVEVDEAPVCNVPG